MHRWHLEETYALTKRAFGAAQERLTRDSTRSVVDRQEFARYHFHETQRLSKAFERRYLVDDTLLDLQAQNAQQKRVAFERYIVKAGAHATAAIQSIHALPDILAHAIYFATGQNLAATALKDREIALTAVVRLLKRSHDFGTLAPLLANTQSGSLWRHLAAAANLSKHRSVVRTGLNEDWTGTRKNFRELHINSFEREGQHFRSLSVEALLAPEYSRLSLNIVTLGNELNACLRRIAP